VVSALVERAVEHAKAGDPEGLHFLYVRYAPDVIRCVDSVVHDRHEAEDITQNVFATLGTAIEEYEPREASFAAWILRLAHSAALDRLPPGRTAPTEKEPVADNGRAQIGRNSSGALRQALEGLPDDQREVLVLRHVVGLSPMEIAVTLDKTESSIHGLHRRGRRGLKANLVALGAPPAIAPPAA
jgi:RNA polymerase sigma-70 factor, ECF subfamily